MAITLNGWWTLANPFNAGIEPVTISCWFKPASYVPSVLVNLLDNSGQRRLELSWNMSLGDVYFRFRRIDPAGTGESLIGPFAGLGVWYHVVGVAYSFLSGAVYVNGSKATENAYGITYQYPLTLLTVGANYGNGNPMNGDIAEVGVWKAALGDVDVDKLARGASPLLVQPGKLFGYYPLAKGALPEPNRMDSGSTLFVVSGGTETPAVHPRMVWSESEWRGLAVDLPRILGTGDLAIAGPTLYATPRMSGPAALSIAGPYLDGAGIVAGVGRVPARFAVEAQLLGVWEELPLLAAVPITCRRGMAGGSPLDHVAVSGEARFAVRNDDPLGLYSPNSGACRPGWTYGVPVRVVARYLTYAPEVIWTGRLEAIMPSPGRYRDRQVACVALDIMNDLAATDARTVLPQINQTENALIAAILETLPASIRPATTYDPSIDTYPYALDNAAEGVLAMSLITDVVMSAQAYAYPLRDGVLHVENRHARLLAVSRYTFDDDALLDIAVPSDLGSVYNDVRVTIHPRTFSDGPIVLFALTGTQAIPAGQTAVIWGDYADPTNALQLVGGIGLIAPIAGTDYAANTVEDGSGLNRTGTIVVTADLFAAAVKFTVHNPGTDTVFLVNALGDPHLQVRGTAVYDDAAATYTAQAPQPWTRILPVDLRYQDDPGIAQDLADYELRQYGTLPDQITALRFDAHRNHYRMVQALRGEIGDLVTAGETVTGVASVPVLVQAVEHTITQGRWLTTRYLTAPKGPRSAAILDDPVYGVLDAPDTRLGYA